MCEKEKDFKEEQFKDYWTPNDTWRGPIKQGLFFLPSFLLFGHLENGPKMGKKQGFLNLLKDLFIKFY